MGAIMGVMGVIMCTIMGTIVRAEGAIMGVMGVIMGVIMGVMRTANNQRTR